MMANVDFRRGSALLVVLGMLSFMLFSGLAFSVYMRQSRLPTSFLRRTSTTRQLAKAALAEAIDQIDLSIGNDPHPGVTLQGGTNNDINDDEEDDVRSNLNLWSHRVFFWQGQKQQKKNATDNRQNSVTVGGGTYHPMSVDPSETVATLTLEGLAYLPPCLVNEARYYSQRTPTAKWQSFWFDSGRFAYTAIDVSDYFDVNRMLADYPRAACGSRRVTLAHLFETGFDHASPGSGAAQWEKFMEKYRSVDQNNDAITYNQYPFVSLADFNVAFGSQKIGGLSNPFYDFISKGKPYDCGESEEDADADMYRRMTFVTDGWFPQPSTKTDGKTKLTMCNLENASYQPFKPQFLEKEGLRPSLREMSTSHSYSDSQMLKWFLTKNGSGDQRLTVPTCAALWDYLDVDSVPVSLCVPTVERTPMVCGVRTYVADKIDLAVTPRKGNEAKVSEKTPLSDGNKWDFYSREVTYVLDISGLTKAKGVQVLLTYPFQEHGMKENLDRNFKVDGRLSVFLTQGDGQDMSIRPSKFSSYPKKETIAKSELTDKALFSFPIAERQVSPKTIVDNAEGGKDCPCYKLDMNVEREFSAGGDLVLAKVKYTWPRDKWVETDDGEQLVSNANPDPGIDSAKASKLCVDNTKIDSVSGFSVYPLTRDGERMDDKTLEAWLRDRQPHALKANVAVWIRVRDTDDYVVDFVPACHTDDQNMNGDSPDRFVAEFGGDSYGYPLLRTVATADGQDGLTYSLSALHGDGNKGTLGAFTVPDTKLLVSDPRYNYASENWVRLSGQGASGELKATDWVDQASAHAAGADKDGDMFMSTSDAGYMQSIYELAFLPRMSNGFNDGDFNSSYLRYGNMSTTFGRNDYATSFTGDDGPKDRANMWRTYSPFGDEDDFADLEEIMTSGSGTKVNPYSDSTKVLMAAFANTPHDWRAAATNNDELFEMDAATFNKKHAWNAYSSDSTGKTCYDCLEEFAGKFQSYVASAAKEGRTWEDAYADMDWSKDKRKLLDSGEELEGDDADLYSVDKKFFYGFWRDCFAARQQLFLIFVRAEPMMMGGGVQGQMPPQLGARAVALVWRDPTATTGKRDNGRYNPHRTRILFYHQFD